MWKSSWNASSRTLLIFASITQTFPIIVMKPSNFWSLSTHTIFLCEFLIFVLTDWASILKEHDYFDILCDNDIAINQVLRDLFVMGNQIPMSFLMKLIEEFPSKDNNKKDELEMGLLQVIKQVDPFKNVAGNWKYCDQENYSEDDSSEILDFCQRSHLLDCLPTG